MQCMLLCLGCGFGDEGKRKMLLVAVFPHFLFSSVLKAHLSAMTMEEPPSAWRYPESSAPTLCVRRGQAAASPVSADAEPRLVVDGPSTYDAGRSERFTTADASGQAVDGAASQRAATASTSVPSI